MELGRAMCTAGADRLWPTLTADCKIEPQMNADKHR